MQPQADGASGCAGRSHQMLGGMALVLVLRLRHVQHGSAAAQPRRSRAERILAVISLKDGHLLARIRILSLDAPQPPEQASRGGALSLGDASSPPREREIVTLRNYLGNGEADESVTKLGLIPLRAIYGVFGPNRNNGASKGVWISRVVTAR